jgi:hypothetical protein
MRSMPAWWILASLAAGFCGCGPSADNSGDADAAGDVGGIDDLEVFEPTPPALPLFTPCPPGWQEQPPLDPSGPATCEPWPDGGPAVLTPCPDGWREVPDAEAGATVCEPWPESGPAECVDDEAQFPGEPGCTRIGTACAAGDDWAVDLPAGSVVRYVKAGAAPGGDGSRSAPFATIAEATAVAAAGDIVAIAKGTYDEQVSVRARVTLWGACVAETILTSSIPDMTSATVLPQGRDGTVRNLQVTGERSAFYARTARSLNVRDVLVHDATSFGLVAVSGGMIVAENVVVRRMRADAELDFGRAVDAEEGGVIRLSRAVFEDNRDSAVFANGAGTLIEGSDVVIRDTEAATATDLEGRGITAQDGARVTLERAVLEHNREFGALAAGVDAVIDLTDTVVRDTRVTMGHADLGIGLSALDGGRITARRTLLERNHTAGVNPRQAGSAIVLEDTIVRDTLGADYGPPLGRGAEATAGGRLVATRTVFARNLEAGVVAAGTGTTLELTDVAIRHTASQPADGLRGDGIVVQHGAAATLTRVLLEANRDLGLQAEDPGTTLQGTDVVVLDTRPQEADGTFGFGLQLAHGSSSELTRLRVEGGHGVGLLAGVEHTRLRLTDALVRNVQGDEHDLGGRGIELQGPGIFALERVWLQGNHDAGLFVSEPGATLTVSDLTVTDTRSRTADLGWGIGLQIQAGAGVTLTRGRFERNAAAGIQLAAADVSLHATDLAVVETLPAECSTTSCVGLAAGSGVVVTGGALLEATRFVLRDNALCGLQLAIGVDTETLVPFPVGGTAELHQGDVVRNVVGVNIQTPEFDIGRLQDQVRYFGNQHNLDSAALPVPESTAPTTGP